jgi:hypothetical protein
MARVDRIKEEIGWLKVPFGLLDTKANLILLAAASIAAIVVTIVIFQINRIAYRRIDDLEEG